MLHNISSLQPPETDTLWLRAYRWGIRPRQSPFFTHAFGHLVVAMTLPAVLYKASTVTDLACTQVVCVLGQQELFGSQV